MTAAPLLDKQAQGDQPHILMTLDAVGGVWRYAMDLALGLSDRGFRFTFVGFGPAPSPAQRAEAERIGTLLWRDAPLDWTTDEESKLDVIPSILEGIVADRAVDMVHINLPSQAAGLQLAVPVLLVSHSCVVTWFRAVRGTDVPPDWQWQFRRNQAGFEAADLVIAPSEAHAAMLRASYGTVPGLTVVYNGSGTSESATRKDALVFAAGRWWDDGKNGALLDEAAKHTVWPVVMAGSQNGPNGQYLPLHAVQALGQIAHDEVAQWMARVAIVASPSRYEPFGLAPLEAARAGAALVLADIPTYRELWDGAALFAAPDDPQGFAGAINALAGDDALRNDFGARAKERSGRFTIPAQANAMAEVYRRLLHPSQAQQA